MPGCAYDDSITSRYRLARAQVRAKFPHLAEGTSGWHRALANRMKRL